MALEYDIERGPQTKLTIDGHPLPRSLVERMEDAWVWAVFDDFLLDDLAAMVKESLTGDGYLRADVQALVVSEPDAALKEIAVRIDPGTRFTDRRIVFSGQEALSASTLDTLIRTRALDAVELAGPVCSSGRRRTAVSTAWIPRRVRQGAATRLQRPVGRTAGADQRGPAVHRGPARRAGGTGAFSAIRSPPRSASRPDRRTNRRHSSLHGGPSKPITSATATTTCA